MYFLRVILFSLIFGGLIGCYLRFVKRIRCGNMVLITGGIKTGKSTLAVRQAYQLWKAQKRKVWIQNYILRFLLLPFTRFKLKPKKEKPLLYSNIPLKCEHVRITKDFLLRHKRPAYGSVAYISEASLIADSMTYRDADLNEQLLLFNKLWGHESKGGYLIYDTQSVSDNHYSVKRCLNSYFNIHHSFKGLFFVWMFIREERYSEDGSAVNVFDGDVEKKLMLHLVPKKTWKLFDCYCYSALTDDCPVEDHILSPQQVNDLKCADIVSFKEYKTLKKEKNK